MVHSVTNVPQTNRALLKHLFDFGVSHCQPRRVLPELLPKDAPVGRNVVLGAGKAAAEMAAVAHDHLQGETVGLVVTRYGHGAFSPTGNIEVVEAGHPVPDENSVEAAVRMLALAESTTRDDRVLFMFSGGGSALLCAPIDGVTAQQKQDLTRFLLHSGARIDEINCVRKHLSRIKGGGLAAKAGDSPMWTYVISDVVGDNPADVASGPSISDASVVDDALKVLAKYGYADQASILDAVCVNSKQRASAHPVHVVATAQTAVDAVAQEAQVNGWTPVVIGVDLEGNASDVGRAHAELALEYRKRNGNFALISGGELTVEVKNPNGRGGPNLEYLTSLMIHLDGAIGIEALACDSDGVDGSEDNAGGFISPTSLVRAASKNIDPSDMLTRNDTYTFFASLDDLVVTGPTRTNINDIRIILVTHDSENNDSK